MTGESVISQAEYQELLKQISVLTSNVVAVRDMVTAIQISQAGTNEQNLLLRSMVLKHEEMLVGKTVGDGLVYQVSEHSKFQSTMEKVLWIIVTPLFALFGVGLVGLLSVAWIIANKP